MNADPAETERFMIFEGVIQWTQAVALQSDRVAAAQAAQFRPGGPGAHRLPGMNFRSECDYFNCRSRHYAVPVQKTRGRPRPLRLDRLLGNRHIVSRQDRVGATHGTLIGGRLDWAALGAAAKRLLPKLLTQPIPYPSIPGMPRPEPALPVRFLSALRAMAWDDQRVAIEWMESPNPALGGLTPAEKVKTPEGMAEVVAILEPMASVRALRGP